MNIKNIAWFNLLIIICIHTLFGMPRRNPRRVASESPPDILKELRLNIILIESRDAYRQAQAERNRIFRDPSTSRRERQRAEQKQQDAWHAHDDAYNQYVNRNNPDNPSSCCTIS